MTGAAIRRWYGQWSGRARHPVSDTGILLVFGITAFGAWAAVDIPLLLAGIVVTIGIVASITNRRWRPLGALGLFVVASSLASASWDAVRHAPVGPYAGPATLVTDPDPNGGAVRVVLEMEGHRYEVWARGIPGRQLRKRLAGEVVVVVGERSRARPHQAGRLAVRHIVGRFDVEVVAGVGDGTPIARAANRLHRRVVDAASGWPADDAALFRGLVVGNDREVSDELIAASRRSGLAHLTAVSGQNVAYVLAMAAPLLRRLGLRSRWVASIALIAWFAVLTRFEPSVLRASFMAGLAISAYTMGFDRRPARLLPLAATLLLLVDPMLVRSVSFWLSVSATSGLVWITPRLARLLPGPGWLVLPAAVTTGAQLGVLPILVVVFGMPSSVSLVANLVAVPVGSAVMLVGVPASVIAAVLPEPLASIVMWPVWAGTRWVAIVAKVGSALAPPRWFDMAAWTSCIALALVGVWRRWLGR